MIKDWQHKVVAASYSGVSSLGAWNLFSVAGEMDGAEGQGNIHATLITLFTEKKNTWQKFSFQFKSMYLFMSKDT